ncbi:hypothetical protein B0T14DRAFT_602650 [Immersiella caudata]|uniref:Uncharacterized protein n=1 Tax=Immersiella caudata TaxID=314043 RepID=A0AA39WZM5_9PEZI|nr:hypothetical protein B0T14DRAFT_602650 [Immersiella caudata]
MSTQISEVYIGAWWSHADETKPALILTLRDNEALILIAALVVFVGFVASRTFGAAQFILHQKRVGNRTSPGVKNTRTPTGPERHGYDGLHQQQQALLRNASGHVHTLWLTAQLAWGWKARLGAWTALRRSLVILLITGVSLAAWTAAQLLLPLLWTTRTDQMLTARSSCDEAIPPHRQPIAETDAQRALEAAHAFNRYYNNRADVAASYQQQCPGNSTGIPGCERIPFPRINWRATDGVGLSLMMGLPNTENVEWQSDPINSNTHLGINAPLEDTVDFQQSLACVPANLTGVVYEKSPNETYGIYRHLWGNITIGETVLPYTTLYNESLVNSGASYQIMSFTNYTNYTSLLTPLWHPDEILFGIPSINERIRSIHLIAANSVTYSSPVLDPIFKTPPFPNPSPNPPPVYSPANPVTVLVCRETHNICSPAHETPGAAYIRGYCVPRPLPIRSDGELFDSAYFNARQRETVKRLRNLIPVGGVSGIIQGLSEPLMAGRTAVRKTGDFGAGWEQRGRLPVDQWKREVSRWFEIGLVMLQMGFLEGREMSEGEVRGLVVERTECGMQRVAAVAGMRNLNLAGIIGTVAIGVFLMSLSWAVVPFVGWWQRRKSRGGPTGVMQWRVDGLFQTQRVAYEATGMMGWDEGTGAVPTTGERVFPKEMIKMRSTL